VNISPHEAQQVEIDVDGCLLLLRTQQVGRLVFDAPDAQIRPMNYVLVDGDIVMRADHLMDLPSRVVFEVDQVDPLDRQGWSVIVRGSAAVLPLDDDDVELIEHLEPWAEGSMSWIIRIRIEEVSGLWVRAGRTAQCFDDRGYV
jgi:nitroimidazol reductase NimA-like FMN-containing flavoprotein (pyridoxamine 5'-phosphate oxidase superfamily)